MKLLILSFTLFSFQSLAIEPLYYIPVDSDELKPFALLPMESASIVSSDDSRQMRLSYALPNEITGEDLIFFDFKVETEYKIKGDVECSETLPYPADLVIGFTPSMICKIDYDKKLSDILTNRNISFDQFAEVRFPADELMLRKDLRRTFIGDPVGLIFFP